MVAAADAGDFVHQRPAPSQSIKHLLLDKEEDKEEAPAAWVAAWVVVVVVAVVVDVDVKFSRRVYAARFPDVDAVAK